MQLLITERERAKVSMVSKRKGQALLYSSWEHDVLLCSCHFWQWCSCAVRVDNRAVPVNICAVYAAANNRVKAKVSVVSKRKGLAL